MELVSNLRTLLILSGLISLCGALHSQTAPGQGSVSLQDTTTWITDFLEAHGCATQTFSYTTHNSMQSWCTTISRSKGCVIVVAFNATYTNSDTGRSNSSGPTSETTIDLSDVDPTQITIGKAEPPHDEMNQVNFVSKDHKRTLRLTVDSEANAVRLKNAANHAVSLCANSSPF
jgi:hypothetical protein